MMVDGNHADVPLTPSEIARLREIELRRENLLLRRHLLDADEFRLMTEICARLGLPPGRLDVDPTAGLVRARSTQETQPNG